MGTFVVAALLLGAVGLICRSMWRQHKMAKLNGSLGCGCDCSDCSGCSRK